MVLHLINVLYILIVEESFQVSLIYYPLSHHDVEQVIHVTDRLLLFLFAAEGDLANVYAFDIHLYSILLGEAEDDQEACHRPLESNDYIRSLFLVLFLIHFGGIYQVCQLPLTRVVLSYDFREQQLILFFLFSIVVFFNFLCEIQRGASLAMEGFEFFEESIILIQYGTLPFFLAHLLKLFVLLCYTYDLLEVLLLPQLMLSKIQSLLVQVRLMELVGIYNVIDLSHTVQPQVLLLLNHRFVDVLLFPP